MRPEASTVSRCRISIHTHAKRPDRKSVGRISGEKRRNSDVENMRFRSVCRFSTAQSGRVFLLRCKIMDMITTSQSLYAGIGTWQNTSFSVCDDVCRGIRELWPPPSHVGDVRLFPFSPSRRHGNWGEMFVLSSADGHTRKSAVYPASGQTADFFVSLWGRACADYSTMSNSSMRCDAPANLSMINKV